MSVQSGNQLIKLVIPVVRHKTLNTLPETKHMQQTTETRMECSAEHVCHLHLLIESVMDRQMPDQNSSASVGQ